MNIIGLGALGCLVAQGISNLNEEVYSTYLVDTKKYKKFKSRKVEQELTPELYEENYKSLKRFFSSLASDSMLVLSGRDLVTSSCLRILEELSPKTKVTVLYLMPDVDLMPKSAKSHEKVIRGVLQEYARSNLLERMYLVSLDNVSTIAGPASLTTRESAMIELVSYYMHMINYYDNSEPVMSSAAPPIPTAKISTVGVFDVKTKQEKMFFDLEFPREIVYYYGISKEKLETDLELYNSIKRHMKEAESESVSYKIFQLTSESECGIVLKHASYIQK